MTLKISLKDVQDLWEENYLKDNNCIECTICGLNINIDEKNITLLCNHQYHKKCIEKWYIKTSSKTCSENYNKRRCPYCRKYGGYLPFNRKVDTYIKHVHDPKYQKYKKKKIMTRCQAFTKSGKKCKLNASHNEYCHIHKNYIYES